MDDGNGKTNHIFKCPMCGKRFYRDATSEYKQGAVKANFVVAYQDVDGRRWAIPTAWPPKLEMTWLQDQIEITAQESLLKNQRKCLDPVAGDDPYENSQQLLQDYLAAQFTPMHFNSHEMTATLATAIRDGCPRYNKGKSFDRVSKNGFLGNNLDVGADIDANAITIEQWPDLIAMMANETARIRHQLSRSDKDGPAMFNVEI